MPKFCVGAEELVEVVERLELLVDRVMPVGEVESLTQALIDARQVPVAEEFGDVGELVAQAGEVDADFAELALDHLVGRAAEARVAAEVAIGTVDGAI